MNWKDTVLFYFKSSDGVLTRRTIEPLLMHGGTYEDSQKRLRILLDGGLIQRIENEKYAFKLTKNGDLEITPYFNSTIELMELVRLRLEKIISSRVDIELKGGITGFYFVYTKMGMFRFHPDRSKEDVLLFVRLPNLIGEALDHKSNEIYISKEILSKTSFLEDIVESHLKMVDEFYSEKA